MTPFSIAMTVSLVALLSWAVYSFVSLSRLKAQYARLNRYMEHSENEKKLLNQRLSILSSLLEYMSDAFHNSCDVPSQEQIEHFATLSDVVRVFARGRVTPLDNGFKWVKSISPEALDELMGMVDQAYKEGDFIKRDEIIARILINESYYVGSYFNKRYNPELSFKNEVSEVLNPKKVVWPHIFYRLFH